jgi:hypothetical protein
MANAENYFNELKDIFKNGDDETKNKLCKNMREVLDDLAWEGFFGTEQQFDPRGDFRDATGGDLDSIVDKNNYLYIVDNILNVDASNYKTVYNEEDKTVIADLLRELQ